MGHIHGERVADLPFPMNVRNKLVNSGRVSAHHFLPQSGWVSYWIKGEQDIPSVIELFKMRYDSQTKYKVSNWNHLINVEEEISNFRRMIDRFFTNVGHQNLMAILQT